MDVGPGVVTRTATPPADGTRKMPEEFADPNRIVPSSPQVPPSPTGASQMISTCPPAGSIRLSFLMGPVEEADVAAVRRPEQVAGILRSRQRSCLEPVQRPDPDHDLTLGVLPVERHLGAVG